MRRPCQGKSGSPGVSPWHSGIGAARTSLALEDEGLVPVPTTLAKHLWRIGQLVVDLQAIAIRIMEVNALWLT